MKQTHYLTLTYGQEGGGDGEQEAMNRSVQVKLATLITPLIGQLQNAMLLSLSCSDETECTVNNKLFVLIVENSSC